MKRILIFDPRIDRDLINLKKSFEKDYEVKIVKCIEAFENMKNIHEAEGGLDYYDLIIMEMYFNPIPLYGYEETFNGLHSGWFLYKQFLNESKAKIIIWSDSVHDYRYPTRDYPERKWGENVVGFVEKDFDQMGIINLVKKHLN